MLATLLTLVVATTPAIEVEVVGDSQTCALRTSVAEALNRIYGAPTSTRDVLVRMRVRTGTVALAIVPEEGTTLRRNLRLRKEACEATVDAIALLVEGHLRDLGWPAPESSRPPPSSGVDSSGNSSTDSATTAPAKSAADANAKSAANSEAKSEANSGVKSGANSDANSDADSGAKSGANSDADSGANSDAKSAANSETKSAANSETNSEANSGAKSEAKSAANSDVNSETNSAADVVDSVAATDIATTSSTTNWRWWVGAGGFVEAPGGPGLRGGPTVEFGFARRDGLRLHISGEFAVPNDVGVERQQRPRGEIRAFSIGATLGAGYCFGLGPGGLCGDLRAGVWNVWSQVRGEFIFQTQAVSEFTPFQQIGVAWRQAWGQFGAEVGIDFRFRNRALNFTVEGEEESHRFPQFVGLARITLFTGTAPATIF